MNGKIAGDANWLMFDYKRGYSPDIESSGIMDIFRLPKFAFYLYQSQRNPVSSPTIFIANCWNSAAGNSVTVYSNCDEVEMMVNGRSLGKQKPDTGRNSNNLIHAPFTFNIAYEPGIITAKGYLKGKQAISTSRATPGKAFKILHRVNYSGKRLSVGKNDVLFVYASVTDKNGTVIPDGANKLKMELTGPGDIVGNSTMPAEAGVAAFLIKAGIKKGKVNLEVSGLGLQSGRYSIII